MNEAAREQARVKKEKEDFDDYEQQRIIMLQKDEEERVRIEIEEREEWERLRIYRITEWEEDDRLRKIRLARLKREQLEAEHEVIETNEKIRLCVLKEDNEKKIDALREDERVLHQEYEVSRRSELEHEREREEIYRMELLRHNQRVDEEESERLRLIKIANAEAERLRAEQYALEEVKRLRLEKLYTEEETSILMQRTGETEQE